MIDIVNEFDKYSINTQIFDPKADALDVKKEYKVDLVKIESIKKSDVVILAVPHDEIISKGWEFILNIMNVNGGIVFDVKGVLNRDQKPKNIKLHRL